MQEAEKAKQILETKKREKEELKDKAPVVNIESEPSKLDTAPVITVDSQKSKSDEGLSGKDIEVIEDALENLGMLLALVHFFFKRKFKFTALPLITSPTYLSLLFLEIA